MPCCQFHEPIIGCKQHFRAASFSACDMKRVESAKTRRLQLRCASEICCCECNPFTRCQRESENAIPLAEISIPRSFGRYDVA
jgi:hypothetical protein